MINQHIEDYASKFLSKHGIEKPAVPVEELAIREGIQVIRSPAQSSESGFLLRDGPKVIIGLNSRNTSRRQRFTIAHELGHWLLHKGRTIIVDHTVRRINKRDSVSSSATDNEEIQANAFAAALLMPSHMVRYAVERELRSEIPTRDDLTSRLASEFDVSQEAMNIRLINLGIYTA